MKVKSAETQVKYSFMLTALMDINFPSPPDNMPAEKFYHLMKAAQTLDPASMDIFSFINKIIDLPWCAQWMYNLSQQKVGQVSNWAKVYSQHLALKTRNVECLFQILQLQAFPILIQNNP